VTSKGNDKPSFARRLFLLDELTEYLRSKEK
jgi:hypothetical protein